MVGRIEHRLRRPELHQPPEVQDRDSVGEVADYAEVVADEDVARPDPALEVDEQVEDRSLDGDVKRRGRLVADDETRVPGEGPCNRDPLLLPAGESRRARRERPFGEPHGIHELLRASLGYAASDARKLGERTLEHPPDRVPAVQRGVRILEDDLEGGDVGG
jgi:hypothetical protein